MPPPSHVHLPCPPNSGGHRSRAAQLFTDAAVNAAADSRRSPASPSPEAPLPRRCSLCSPTPPSPSSSTSPGTSSTSTGSTSAAFRPNNADSNYRMTNEAMLSKVPLPAEQIYRMEGELDPEVAAARYESTIRNTFKLEGAQTPTFDLVLLGMGDDGHTASLFPHTEALNDITHIVVANHVPQKDTWRITLTWPVINQGREVAFLIEGAAKAQVLHDVLLGPYQPDTFPRSSSVRPAESSPSCSTPPQQLSFQSPAQSDARRNSGAQAK